MRADDGQPPNTDDALVPEERKRRADGWEAGADERERLADERERLAEEREVLADERERLADRFDHVLDLREASDHVGALLGETGEEADEEVVDVAAADAAVLRAEAAMRRAEADVLRARQAAALAGSRAARRCAAAERTAAERVRDGVEEDEDLAWLADRRDFVAAERDALANERNEVADDRGSIAALRERLADGRDHELLDRERRLDRRQRASPATRTSRRVAFQDGQRDAELRARNEQRRERAAVARRAAAADRFRAADSWGPQAYGPMLVATFARLAQLMFGSDDLTGVLPQVLKYAVDTVAGCESASVTLWRHDRVVDTTATGAAAAEFDDVQFGTGLGPGPEALRSARPVYAPRIAESARWPALAAVAAQNGIASALCHGLFVQHPAQWSALGTLNLYGSAPDAFGEEDREFVSILAAYAAVGVALADRRDEVDRREAALHRSLSSRDVIGQAKGILMVRQHLSAGAAFDVLRHASQRLNRKLTEIAEHLAETGELPD